MNSFEEDGHRHEIVIVKRGHNYEEDDHHGGVWKIAFADFMTAMMCFFLVMWLINAADEETRSALASYFNPVNLVDHNSSRKGLEELEGPQPTETSPEEEDDSEPPTSAPAKSSSASSPSAEESARSDEHLFSDPYAVLAEIAADTGLKQNVSSKGDGGAQTSGPATGASGGESYRDPFAPDFWSRQVQGTETQIPVEEAERSQTELPAQEAPSPQTAQAGQEEARIAPLTEAPAEKPAEAVRDAPTEATPDAPAIAEEVPPPEDVAEASQQKEVAQKQDSAQQAEAKAQQQPNPEQVKAAEAIRQELAEAFGTKDKLAEGISVSAIDRGVVISITDHLNFGMFEIGSAVPRRDMVLAMEKIGKILGAREGNVAVNGHTDGRPFKSAAYDNWRLSTARAHAAYYMLVRGGLNEQRIVEVAGFADRKLKVADDPFADTNRRIEILLELGG